MPTTKKPTQKVTKKSSARATSSAKQKSAPKKKTQPIQKKRTPRRKETIVPKPPVQLPHSTALSVLSRFRFPLPLDVLMPTVARVAGVVFVVLGGLFTLLNVGTVMPENSALRAVGSVIGSTETASTDDSLKDTTTTQQSITDPTPPVLFSVLQKEPLAGGVDVSISVTDAKAVTVMAHHTETLTSFPLGIATQKDEQTWLLKWETKTFPDGFYKLSVVVKNQYGSYQERDTMYYQVTNADEVPTAIDTTVHGTTHSVSETNDFATTDDSVVPVDPIVQFRLASPLEYSGVLSLEIDVDYEAAIDGVTLYLRDSNQSVLTASELQSKDGTRWVGEIDTRMYEDDSYRFIAEVHANGIVFAERSASFLITNAPDNTTNADVDTASTKVILLEDSPDTVEKLLLPKIEVKIPEDTLIDKVPVEIRVDSATAVEVYLEPEFSATQRYVAQATQVDQSTWRLLFDTEQAPNGSYRILVKVLNQAGAHTAYSDKFVVKNEKKAEYTAEEIERMSIIEAAEDEVTKTLQEEKTRDSETEKPPALFVSSTSNSNIKLARDRFEEQASPLFQKLTAAVRAGDVEQIEDVRTQLTALRQEQLKDLDEKTVEELGKQLIQAIADTEERIELIQKIVSERVSKEVFTDSDSDGVTDYDEVTIFETDPFSADTDKDGFIDSAEIEGGFDPIDPSPEAVIVYESPKEEGIIRDDVLSVNSVIAVVDNETEGDEVPPRPKALLSGTALPNSYVTLYIFSTPIVITVKTDRDGNWSYIFDKELENGEHEVYVGVTDNSGRVLAKSNPFTFVKTAEAFTPVGATSDRPILQPTDSEGTLFNQRMMLVVLSLSVVSIGLVLLLFGLYLNRREPQVEQPAVS